ncbi:flagellar protein [Thermococcus chitonophagus]|uniref:Flagella-related protein FlaF n=1 Tax=Thermococcus chitonophagus TaxID=54262 RepID=A0A170SMQ7_9EURY|nr:flagellar protein [Thermococcus chitonophagus]ASJ17477.1 flagellar protein [Thermococcus chitonophagus]CUX78124.1 Flagella-related protein FlaF [Thermococcus chitonophagus]
MGFSVSASAAIIFISFLIAVGTLYTAWDNSYNEVQAAREFWYSLKLSQLNFKIGEVSVYNISATDVDVKFQFLGQTIPGDVDVIYNGAYVASVDLGYLIPGNDYAVTIPNGADTSGSLNYATLAFDNGCLLIITYYYNGSSYIVNSSSTQCPVEVN